ncbi:poly-beta-1,6 N-acetyl-D-glucosamine export porin PgaA [Celerinatantimonas sp. MCCC 1A17872]|uniref:poly-beta-1,6 N-acetyl-D-glucosamine export porin PgaA n=1 Tax=Celerinatantimonas sp. MCCC 1A17872 TaxID=3177514 RepID=UPI0038C35E30
MLMVIAGTAFAQSNDYDHLIKLARNGDVSPLLVYLKDKAALNQLSHSQIADLLEVSQWADHDREVIALWQAQPDHHLLPTRAFAAVGRAYRNTQQWDNAIKIWQIVLHKAPHNDDYYIDYVMTLADSGDYLRAQHLAQTLLNKDASESHYLLLGYVLHKEKLYWQQLDIASRAKQLFHSRKTLNFWIMSLADAGVDYPAYSYAKKENLSQDTQYLLANNVGARLVKHSFTDGRNELQRYLVADKALDWFKNYSSYWQNNYSDTQTLRPNIDILGAYLNRQQYQKVVDYYHQLIKAHVSVPTYAKQWVASAELSLRHPEAAFKLLHPLIQKADKDTQKADKDTAPDFMTLSDQENDAIFYAEIETERFNLAHQQVEEFLKQQPYYHYEYGLKILQANDQWLLGKNLQLNYLSGTNELNKAQRLAQQMANSAPGNQDLLISYASVLEQRGLTHHAWQELAQAQVLYPRDVTLEQQQAQVAFDLQNWQSAEQLTDDVISRDPLSLSNRQLSHRRDVFHMYELTVSVGKGLHSSNPVSGNHDLSVETRLYSKPIAENWRLFTEFAYANSRYDEDNAFRRDGGGGLEWRSLDNWAELDLTNWGDSNRQLASQLSYWHDFNDHWRLGGSLARHSKATPLRASNAGIYANQLQAYVRWYQNERRYYQLSVAPSDYSDGNHRWEFTLDGSERLYTQPRLTVDLLPNLSSSTNSLADTVYYNPRRDIALSAAVQAEHILYRRYDTVWSQIFLVGSGYYWEKNYSGGAIAQLGYGQHFQWNQQLDSTLMVTWGRQPYDGSSENDLALSFDLDARF